MVWRWQSAIGEYLSGSKGILVGGPLIPLKRALWARSSPILDYNWLIILTISQFTYLYVTQSVIKHMYKNNDFPA